MCVCVLNAVATLRELFYIFSLQQVQSNLLLLLYFHDHDPILLFFKAG